MICSLSKPHSPARKCEVILPSTTVGICLPQNLRKLSMTDETIPSSEGINPLNNYVLNGRSDELKKRAQEQVPLLGGLAVKGQAGAWYAGPNVGKTLTAIAMLKHDVKQGLLAGNDCYYVAADDSAAGVLAKLEILDRYNVHVVAPGFEDFEASHLPVLIERSIANGSAKRRFLILDTMKKFTNLMDKGESSRFASYVRKFTLHGGTVLGLAHTNKRTDQEGNPIFAGTSDIRDDFDNVFTMKRVPSVAKGQTFIQADCIKSRGSVAQQALISYADDPDREYAALVASVRMIEPDEHKRMMAEIEMARDAEVIAAVLEQIHSGTTGKMAIAKQVARDVGVGRNTIDALIDKYTGNDPTHHRWTYDVRGHGLRVYRMIGAPPGQPVIAPGSVF